MDEDKRIKYICNERNSGAAITRNNALKVAKGRWIAFLDSDDLWLPEKLEKQVAFMAENGYAFSYHEYTEMTEDGKDLGVYVSGIKKVSKFDMFACCWPGCLAVMYDHEKIGLIQINDVKTTFNSAIGTATTALPPTGVWQCPKVFAVLTWHKLTTMRRLYGSRQ